MHVFFPLIGLIVLLIGSVRQLRHPEKALYFGARVPEGFPAAAGWIGAIASVVGLVALLARMFL